jgi:hypothetical protein
MIKLTECSQRLHSILTETNFMANIKAVNMLKITVNTLLLNVATFFAKKEN